MQAREELQAEVEAIPWYHTIDLGDGIVTPGMSQQADSVDRNLLPNFEARTVLDIGAWDGYYSFLAEREGAKAVTALDHYAWGVDIEARQAYWDECKRKGVLPDHDRDATDFYNPDLPGRRGFELAKRALSSGVEPVVADFATMDLATLGEFDVVLYLGVLYHMKEPLGCLERVRAVTREVAVIETVAMHLPDFPNRSYIEFFPGGELNNDFGNWYVPTIEALRGWAMAAGFSRTEIKQGPPPVAAPPMMQVIKNRIRGKSQSPVSYYRAIIQAWV